MFFSFPLSWSLSHPTLPQQTSVYVFLCLWSSELHQGCLQHGWGEGPGFFFYTWILQLSQDPLWKRSCLPSELCFYVGLYLSLLLCSSSAWCFLMPVSYCSSNYGSAVYFKIRYDAISSIILFAQDCLAAWGLSCTSIWILRFFFLFLWRMSQNLGFWLVLHWICKWLLVVYFHNGNSNQCTSMGYLFIFQEHL